MNTSALVERDRIEILGHQRDGYSESLIHWRFRQRPQLFRFELEMSSTFERPERRVTSAHRQMIRKLLSQTHHSKQFSRLRRSHPVIEYCRETVHHTEDQQMKDPRVVR